MSKNTTVELVELYQQQKDELQEENNSLHTEMARLLKQANEQELYIDKLQQENQQMQHYKDQEKEMVALRKLLNEVAMDRDCFHFFFDDVRERYYPDGSLGRVEYENNCAWCDKFNKVMW